MLLPEWCEAFGDGAITALFRESAKSECDPTGKGVSPKTISKAAKGKPVVYEVAEKLSAASKLLSDRTGGKWCTIDELRYPDRGAQKTARRAS